MVRVKFDNVEKRPAVFLDRDGVLTEEKSYITNHKDLKMFSYTKECVKRIKNYGYYAIVVTNQSAVARGMLSIEELNKMNGFLKKEIGVDAVFYCPHHPNAEILEYRKICDCRKPETGLFKQAMERFSIDMSNSYMIGDRASDILAGQKMGLTTILLETGYGTEKLEFDIKPDYLADNLCTACDILEKSMKKL